MDGRVTCVSIVLERQNDSISGLRVIEMELSDGKAAGHLTIWHCRVNTSSAKSGIAKMLIAKDSGTGDRLVI